MCIFLTLFSFLAISCIGDDPSVCTDFCDELAGSEEFGEVFKNYGDCVSLCTTCTKVEEDDNKLAVCYCNYIEAILNAEGADWEDFGVKNKGQCIKLVKNEIQD